MASWRRLRVNLVLVPAYLSTIHNPELGGLQRRVRGFSLAICSQGRGCCKVRQYYALPPVVTVHPKVALSQIPLKMRGRLNQTGWAMHFENAKLWRAFSIPCPDACSGLRMVVKELVHRLTIGIEVHICSSNRCVKWLGWRYDRLSSVTNATHLMKRTSLNHSFSSRMYLLPRQTPGYGSSFDFCKLYYSIDIGDYVVAWWFRWALGSGPTRSR
jgi:hypothetical protein